MATLDSSNTKKDNSFVCCVWLNKIQHCSTRTGSRMVKWKKKHYMTLMYEISSLFWHMCSQCTGTLRESVHKFGRWWNVCLGYRSGYVTAKYKFTINLRLYYTGFHSWKKCSPTHEYGAIIKKLNLDQFLLKSNAMSLTKTLHLLVTNMKLAFLVYYCISDVYIKNMTSKLLLC